MELYAVKYGEGFRYGTYQTIFKGNESTELVPGFVFLYYIVKYNNKIILFDTGFRSKKTAKYYDVKLIDVAKEVNLLIGQKSKVNTIFITHAHFDHIDDIDLYPNAEIIIAKEEYEAALKKQHIAPCLKARKVQVVERDYLFENIFHFQVIGGHCEGSSVIYFRNENQDYVITGDEVYMLDNLIHNIPNGQIVDTIKNQQFIEDVHRHKLVGLPYHDNKIMEQYPAISPNIVRII